MLVKEKEGMRSEYLTNVVKKYLYRGMTPKHIISNLSQFYDVKDVRETIIDIHYEGENNNEEETITS